MRRFGESPKRGQSYRQRQGAYAVLIRGEEVLLTFQAAPLPEMQLPGGGIDAGESAVQALHREVFEETGWAIAAPRRIGTYRRFTYMPDYNIWAEKLCAIFVARPVIARSAPLEPAHEAVWCPISDAAALLSNSGDRYFLEAAIKQAARNR